MAKTTYKLIINDAGEKVEVLRSTDADILRSCGPVMAKNTGPEAELMLIDPKGAAVAAYDIWSSSWQSAA